MNERNYSIRIFADGRRLVSIDDFRLAESSVNVLFGESGIGKTLIARAICGLLDPEEIRASVNRQPYEKYLSGGEVAEMRRNGFFVFQEPSSHLNPLMTLREQLREGNIRQASEDEILSHLWIDRPTKSVERLLQVYPKPYRPSGGEKQRVLATMAFKKMSIVTKGSPGALFVFDEPTGNLDDRLRDEFLDLLMEYFRTKQFTILLITHDYSMVSRLTKEYREIAKNILFRELTMDRSGLQLRDFAPSEYLSWLATRKQPKAVSDRKELLRLDADVRVFGRRFTITRADGNAEPCPLVIHKGRMTYLKAPSGTGKTTILKLMMGLVNPEKMSLQLLRTEYNQRTSRRAWQRNVWGKAMTMVFQHADESLNQNSNVSGVFSGLRVQSLNDDATMVRMLRELFEEEISAEFLAKPVKLLSGGQKQRLNLLRSLILDTQILLLDEPLNGLDLRSSIKVLSKVEDKLAAGKGVLVVSHHEEIFDSMVGEDDVYYLTASA